MDQLSQSVFVLVTSTGNIVPRRRGVRAYFHREHAIRYSKGLERFYGPLQVVELNGWSKHGED